MAHFKTFPQFYKGYERHFEQISPDERGPFFYMMLSFHFMAFSAFIVFLILILAKKLRRDKTPDNTKNNQHS